MDKLTLAHDYFTKHVNTKEYGNVDDDELIGWSWQYADAMFEEAEKRKDKTLPDVILSDFEKEAVKNANIYGTGFIKITKDGNEFKYESVDPKLVTFSISSENWQPDWSLAPKWAEAWAMDLGGGCSWFDRSDHVFCGDKVWYGTSFETAPSFDYTGDWRNSLRIRPSSK